MSKVRIVMFPCNEIHTVLEDMNGFLGKDNIKYVSHTFSAVYNPNSVTHEDKEYCGSIAYQLGDSKLVEGINFEKK